MHHKSRTLVARQAALRSMGLRPRKHEVWTYLAEMPEVKMLKIGVSVRPRARVSAIASGSPFEVRLVAVVSGDREDELHARFREHRVRSEWFRDVRAIRRAFAEEAR